LPGTKVLQFAFDGHSDNPHLPHNYAPDSVVYTGTHDNNTTRGWYEELPGFQRDNLWRYLKKSAADASAAAELINLAWSSGAALAMTPLQDLLNLGQESRMNRPGGSSGNWRWRCTDEMLKSPAFGWLGTLTEKANRTGALPAATAAR